MIFNDLTNNNEKIEFEDLVYFMIYLFWSVMCVKFHLKIEIFLFC